MIAELAWLVESQGLGTMIAIIAIAFLAGFVHTAIGFGFGIVAVTLMPLVVEVRQAHVVISVASIPVMIGVAWTYRRGFDPRPLGQALLGGLIGMPLGLWAFESVSSQWLIRGTGMAILVMIALSLRNRSRGQDSLQAKESQCYGAGFLAGFLAGAVSIAGPPVAAFALRQPWTQARFKAFLNQFLLAISVVKVAGLGARGFLTQGTLGKAAFVAPCAIMGIWLGAKVSDRIPAKWFERIVVVALVVISIWFLI